ncbi:MAG: FAD-binding protein [Candidatus Melainabacteria bacterium]|nr:FAD-binding protein [Candidatus Melainabacteria bacterium]
MSHKQTISNLISDLSKILSADQILDSDTDRYLYDTDATSLFKQKAALIVIANSTEDVSRIVKLINNYPKLNFLARGAGTGLSGGAIGDENTVIISTAGMNKLIASDFDNRMALIETGLVNSALSELVKSSGLHFSPDPSSQDSCTIGGNIAENAGGIHCYKHGVSSDQILGLELVMPDGEIVYFGEINEQACKAFDLNQKAEKIYQARRSQIDFSRLFTGSEGTLGIATKALVQLQKIPESFLTMQIAFGSAIEAAQLVSAVIREGFKPTALEMIDEGALEAVCKSFDLGIPTESKAVLLLELDGDNDEILLEAKAIRELIEREFKPLLFKESQDPEERKFLWKVRKGTVAAFGKIAPYWYLYDAVVPRSKIPEATERIEEIAAKYDLKLASVLHAADGNLHPNFLYDPDKDPEVIDRIHKASHEIMKLCIELGGVLSGEHGIGVEKRDYMPFLFSDEDMETMLKLRKVFDPKMISNPGKIFPVRICKYC